MQKEFLLENGLYCRIDWVEFTIDTLKSDYVTFKHYLESLGFFAETFDDTERGGIGYQRCFKHVSEDIFGFFTGNADMGIHFRVCGSAVKCFFETYLTKYKCEAPFGVCYDVGEYDTTYIAPMLFKYILSIGHFTRIDLAVDDIGCKYYSCNDIVDVVSKGCCVGKFKLWKNVSEKSLASVGLGHTVYFGSRKSDVMLRVYDKSLEQNLQDLSPVKWIRWELELKHERADIVAKLISSKNDLGFIAVGILNEYIRFIVPDNVRRCRCSVAPLWLDFIDTCSKIPLSIAPRESSIDKKVQWIDKQVKPTIAGLLTAFDGDLTFLTENLNVAFERLSYKDKQLFLNASGGGKDDL